MAKRQAVQSFSSFIALFEEVPLPLTLSPESVSVFSQRNESLAPDVIAEYLPHIEQDEFTEIIPCLRIADASESIILVYWQGGLLHYSFHIISFTKKGERVADRVIAGTLSDQDDVLHRVATIDEDWIIYIVEGLESARGEYDPNSNRSLYLEILSTGDIIESEEEPPQ